MTASPRLLYLSRSRKRITVFVLAVRKVRSRRIRSLLSAHPFLYYLELDQHRGEARR
jgi:hypothetical protein